MTGVDYHQKEDEFVAVKNNLQSALKDAMDLSNADYDTLEDIADGLEKMLHSWNDVQEQRAHEYAKLKESLARDTSQCQKGTVDMKETLEDIGIKVSVTPRGGSKKGETYVGIHKGCEAPPEQEEEEQVPSTQEKWLPEWAALLNKSGEGALDSDRSSAKRKVVATRGPIGVRAMPLKKKPRKQMITVQIDEKRDKAAECTCDEGGSPNGPGSQAKRSSPRTSPLHFIKGKESPTQMKRKIEELQIALLESATEYELKILQMKMQMHQNKNETPPKPQPHMHIQPEDIIGDGGDVHAVDCSRKQVSRLHREKKSLTQEVYIMRKRERMFEQQRKVLEDAQYRVNCLKRELMKKEGQLVNAQLREKAAAARVALLEDMLKRSDAKYSLLPEMYGWLQSIRKDFPPRVDQALMLQVQHYESEIAKQLEAAQNRHDDSETVSTTVHKNIAINPPVPSLPQQKHHHRDPFRKVGLLGKSTIFEKFPNFGQTANAPHCHGHGHGHNTTCHGHSNNPLGKQNKESRKEAQALQRELHKLAHPGSKSKQPIDKNSHESEGATEGAGQPQQLQQQHHHQPHLQQQQQQHHHLHQQRHEHSPYWLYGAAMLLGGILFKKK